MSNGDRLYIQHILDAIAKIERYLIGIDKTTFLENDEKQDSVIRQLEIIGEAVKRLSPSAKSLQAQIPWSAIAGMRDRLIHGYFNVDLDQVWYTTVNDIPILKSAVSNISTHLQL